MKYLYCSILAALMMAGCSSSGSGVASNDYPTHKIPAKTTHVPEEKPDKYPHPPEDLRSVVGHDGWYRYGGYYYPSRNYYNRYYWYYH